MNKLLKPVICIGFCLMFCFLSIGYANLNDGLTVTGSVSYEIEMLELDVNTDHVTGMNVEVVSSDISAFNTTRDMVLHFIPHEGYSLPESFQFEVENTVYSVATSGESNPVSILWNRENSMLHISGEILPADGGTLTLTAHAVQESPNFTLTAEQLQNISVTWYTTNGCLCLSLIPADGFVMPDTLDLCIGETHYTVNTTDYEENPALMGYNPIEKVLTIHFDLISQNSVIMLIGEAVSDVIDEDSEATEDPID